MSQPKTCFELRAALDDLAMPHQTFAKICGVKPVQVWRWCEGKADVPAYVWAILTLAKGGKLSDVATGKFYTWRVRQEHVYRNGKSFKSLARRFHPDVSGRDTTAEMQIVNAMRKP